MIDDVRKAVRFSTLANKNAVPLTTARSRALLKYGVLIAVALASWSAVLPVQAEPSEVRGFGGWSWIGPKKKWSYRKVSAEQGPVLDGKSAERFEIHAGDCGRTGGYNDCRHDREHIGWNETSSTKLGVPVWYSVSVYVPATTPTKLPGDVNVILAEWRPIGPGQINLSIELQRDGLVAVVGSTKKQQKNDMKPPPPAMWTQISFSPPTDTWISLELQVTWSTGTDGDLVLYRNGQQVAAHRGPNTAFNKPVHMQYGIYRSFVSKAKEPLPKQVFFFDKVRKAPSRELLNSP